MPEAVQPNPQRHGVKYPKHSPFWTELEARVDGYFETHGKNPTGGARLVVKSVLVTAWLVTSYVLLVFFADAWWNAIPLAISLGLSVAGVGFNIQHDGGHDAYSRTRWVNRLTAWTLDLVGGSSYVWRMKHAVLHHHFTNIDGVDEDIDGAPFLRLSPVQRRSAYHRFQHWYAWPLFGFLPPKWAYYDDFMSVILGRVGKRAMPRPRAGELTLLLIGKVAYTMWTLGIPLLVGHSLLNVALIYVLCALTTGIALSVVFQLAHCVEEAEFMEPPTGGEKMDHSWAEHQLATTVDFAPGNRLITWYVGGLNHQVEHHLFPRVSHIHYPALAPIVQKTCEEFGVRYRVHQRFSSAVASHVRHLRQLGRPQAPIQAA